MGSLRELATDLSTEGMCSLVAKLSSSISRVWERRLREGFVGSRVRAVGRARRATHTPKLRAVITPGRTTIEFPHNINVAASTVSNPALTVSGSIATLYLRVSTIGSRFGGTLIAVAELGLDELAGVVGVRSRVLLPPLLPGESVEDPRIDLSSREALYHVRVFRLRGLELTTTFLGRLKGGGVLLQPVVFTDGGGDFILSDYRDTFPLNRGFMVVRPYFSDLGSGGVFVGPREGNLIYIHGLKPIPQLMPGRGEVKTGGNCVVPIGNHEYLLIYHAVDSFGIYRCYPAILDDSANLVALSREPILVPNPELYSGRRPGTVFPCGAAVHGGSLLIASGLNDEVVAIYESPLNEVLSAMRATT